MRYVRVVKVKEEPKKLFVFRGRNKRGFVKIRDIKTIDDIANEI